MPAGQTYTRGTPNVRGALTADAANGLVYLGTGNASPDYWIGYRRSFDDQCGSSIIALEIATGKLRWIRQLLHCDIWDMDLPIGPSLFNDRAANGQVIPALIQTTKMGRVFFLNRLNGAPIAATTEKTGPHRRRDAGGARFADPALLDWHAKLHRSNNRAPAAERRGSDYGRCKPIGYAKRKKAGARYRVRHDYWLESAFLHHRNGAAGANMLTFVDGRSWGATSRPPVSASGSRAA